MSKPTRLDQLLTWFKNNRVFAIVMLAAAAIVAVAQVLDSLAHIWANGQALTARALLTSALPPGGAASTESVKPILVFGGKGIGPGKFTDPRFIGVDAAGRIYVQEFADGGRVQAFDAAGRFLAQWHLSDDTVTPNNFAVDREGSVYVAQDNAIVRYRGLTGEQIETIRYNPDSSGRRGDPTAEDVKTTADGGLVTAWNGETDTLVLFDQKRTIQRSIPSALSAHDKRSGDYPHLAVDGSGNVFAIDHYGYAVFKFSPRGEFVTRFGSDGLDPGQFHLTLAIAVDSRGRVYASDIQGIQMFDNEGRFLKRLPVDQWVMGLAFNDRDELFATSGDRVLKFASFP